MRAELIVVTEHRLEALARLDVFVGEWVIEARFPAGQPAPANAQEEGPQARSWFEWALDGRFLVQRTEIPVPEAPDSLAIVSVDPETGAYIQHYYDSRGVARLYAMSLAGLRLYRATVGSHWILANDGRPDHRIPVPLS